MHSAVGHDIFPMIDDFRYSCSPLDVSVSTNVDGQGEGKKMF